MQLTMPDNVRFIINKLQDNGYEAYAVGGCVRDSYLGEVPHDWDITTNALPHQVKSLFRRTIDVGIVHGTVKIMIGDDGYEVTTYRIDGEYEDSRHPKEVTFTLSLEEDLKRRDFTINAMAYSEKTGIIDLFGGIQDLKAGIIRAVGDPKERFSEDALRMLRALRFSARFGYEIEENTQNAIRQLAPTLANISAERIREELEKLILSDNPDRMRWAYELGVTKVFFPEWDAMMECEQNTPYHYLSVGEHTIKAMEYLVTDYSNLDEKDARVVRIATMLHDVAKPIMKTTDEEGIDHFKGHPDEGAILAPKILRRLKYDNDTIRKVTTLVQYHDLRPRLTYPYVRRAMAKVGASSIDNLMILKHVDLKAQSDYKLAEKSENLEAFEKMSGIILDNKDPLTIKELAVTGSDLIKLGITPGPKLGELLECLLLEVMDKPEINTTEELLTRVEKIANEKS